MPNPVHAIHTDGACKGNPGHASIAYVITDADGETVLAQARYIGRETNNVAEYTALVEALTAAHELGVRRVEAFSDSELMVKQVSGEYRVKNEVLRPLCQQVLAGLRLFESASLTHVPREQNSEADKLAGDAIRAHLEAEGPSDAPEATPDDQAAGPAPVSGAQAPTRAAGRGQVYSIHTDGASKGNPGHASIAYVITDADGETVVTDARYIGAETNNVAEYTALVEALDRARELGLERVEAFSDSELMVKQVSGAYAVRNETLRPLCDDVIAGLRVFKSASLTYVPRAENKRADKLAGDAIKEHLNARQKDKRRVRRPPR
jgi:ribonuclease HI